MTWLTKLKAIASLALVSGVFWGVVAAIGGVSYQIIHYGVFQPGYWWYVAYRFFLMGLPMGFVGGGLYAAAIALMPRDEQRGGLSATKAAIAGAIGGMLLFLGIKVFLLTGPGVTASLTREVVTTLVFGVLGAGTSLAIHGTASRGRLPRETESPRQITR